LPLLLPPQLSKCPPLAFRRSWLLVRNQRRIPEPQPAWICPIEFPGPPDTSWMSHLLVDGLLTKHSFFPVERSLVSSVGPPHRFAAIQNFFRGRRQKEFVSDAQGKRKSSPDWMCRKDFGAGTERAKN
jgi:hypothetical protein